jgi:hypothetical protein
LNHTSTLLTTSPVVQHRNPGLVPAGITARAAPEPSDGPGRRLAAVSSAIGALSVLGPGGTTVPLEGGVKVVGTEPQRGMP